MSNLIHAASYVGIDEAGRGPLAGPVVAAAVWLPEHFDCTGLNDSKALNARQREEHAARIREHATFAIAVIDSQEIDRTNILAASLSAMARAYEQLCVFDKTVLIDGNCSPPALAHVARCEVRGDSRFSCIAAASILAKTERDRMMREFAVEFPQYGFDQHFGYATADHLASLRHYGPCPLHRMSFAPVAEIAYQLRLF